MNQDWWVQLGVNSSVDEWTFTEALGDQAEEVLAEHWNTWVTEDDIELAFQHGVNMIRIPVGFWAFIPTSDEIEDEPYCALCGQKEQMERVMEYAYNRSMRVIIDIHGLPGSQNGEQSESLAFSEPCQGSRARRRWRAIVLHCSGSAWLTYMILYSERPLDGEPQVLQHTRQPQPLSRDCTRCDGVDRRHDISQHGSGYRDGQRVQALYRRAGTWNHRRGLFFGMVGRDLGPRPWRRRNMV